MFSLGSSPSRSNAGLGDSRNVFRSEASHARGETISSSLDQHVSRGEALSIHSVARHLVRNVLGSQHPPVRENNADASVSGGGADEQSCHWKSRRSLGNSSEFSGSVFRGGCRRRRGGGRRCAPASVLANESTFSVNPLTSRPRRSRRRDSVFSSTREKNGSYLFDASTVVPDPQLHTPTNVKGSWRWSHESSSCDESLADFRERRHSNHGGLLATADPCKPFVAEETSAPDEESENTARCRLRSVVLVALVMCTGIVMISLLVFLPLYFVTEDTNTAAVDVLLAQTLQRSANIFEEYLTTLPALVSTVASTYIPAQNITTSEARLPASLSTLLLSLAAVLIHFEPQMRYLQFILSGQAYTMVRFANNATVLSGSQSHQAVTVPELLMHQDNISFVQPPRVVGSVDFDAILSQSQGPMQRVVIPWFTEGGPAASWLPAAAPLTGTYFNYVVPFAVGGALGYCQAGFAPTNILLEAVQLVPYTQRNGRAMLWDYHRDVVIGNSWDQPTTTTVETHRVGGLTYTTLKLADISDPLMRTGIEAMRHRREVSELVAASSSAVERFVFKGKRASLYFVHLNHSAGLDIVVMTAFFNQQHTNVDRSARRIIIITVVVVIVAAIFIALLIAFIIVRPLQQLVRELQRDFAFKDGAAERNEELDVYGEDEQTSVLAEIRDIQIACRALKRDLLDIRSYVPHAVVINKANRGSMQEKQDGRLGRKRLLSIKPWPNAPPNFTSTKERLNEFRRKPCTLVLVQVQVTLDADVIQQYLQVFSDCIARHCGCEEHLGHDHILFSFGAHAPLPIHPFKGCQFALDVYTRLPVHLREHVVLLIDSSEFMVGTCGDEQCCFRVVSEVEHLFSIAKVLRHINCRVAATHRPTTYLPDYQSIPVDCVLLPNSKTPVVLSELRVAPGADCMAQVLADTICCRSGFFEMRRGQYGLAVAYFNAVQRADDVQVKRLLRLCRQRFSTGDCTPYMRYIEDVYHFENWGDAAKRVSAVLPRDSHPASLRAATAAVSRAAPDATAPPLFTASLTAAVLPARAPAALHAQYNDGSPLLARKPEESIAFSGGSFASDASSPLVDLITTSLSCTDEEVSYSGDGVPLNLDDHNGRCWRRSFTSISSGAFSVVYLGMSEDGVQAAIKCIPRLRRDIKEGSLQDEMKTMAKLRHPNIVQYISFSVTPSHLALIMEYVPGGSLYAVIRNFGRLNATVVRRFMLDIVSGLIYLHNDGIVHCDVKPHNMLLGMDGVCKLSDFGSTISEATDMARTAADEFLVRGTALYMAPEVARGERSTAQSDVFSVGISLLEMLLGRLPWRWSSAAAAEHDEAALQALLHSDARFMQCLSKGEVQVDVPDTLDREVYSFAKECCQVDPAKRPGLIYPQPPQVDRSSFVNSTADAAVVHFPNTNAAQHMEGTAPPSYGSHVAIDPAAMKHGSSGGASVNAFTAFPMSQPQSPFAIGDANSAIGHPVVDMTSSLIKEVVAMIPAAAPPEMCDEAQLIALALQLRCVEGRGVDDAYQSVFHSSRIPGISIWDYARRIAKYSGCSSECFIIAMILLDRYSAATHIPITFRNVHRLIIAAAMVCAKLRDDIYYSNSYYASIGGVNLRELNHLELVFLSTIQWDTWVEATVYNYYEEQLRAQFGQLLPPKQR